MWFEIESLLQEICADSCGPQSIDSSDVSAVEEDDHGDRKDVTLIPGHSKWTLTRGFHNLRNNKHIKNIKKKAKNI